MLHTPRMSTTPTTPSPAEPVPSVPYGPAGPLPVGGTPDAVPVSTGRNVRSTIGKIAIRAGLALLIRAIFRALFRG